MKFPCFRAVFLIALAVGLSSKLDAQVSISYLDTLVIDFDNTFTGVNLDKYQARGVVDSLVSPRDTGRLDSRAWSFIGLSSNSTQAFGETDTTINTDFTRGNSAGGEGTGGLYSFEVETDNFTLGWQPVGSDFSPGSITLMVINTGDTLINQIEVDYDIWTYNDQDNSSRCNFSFSKDSINFILLSDFNFSSSGTADIVPAWSKTDRSIFLTDLQLLVSDTLYLRWELNKVGNGAQDELALDSIQIAASPERRFYRSAGNGDWTDFEMTWENSFFLGGPYQTARTFPSATNSDTIIILGGDSIVLDIDLSANSIRIDSLAYLRIDTSSLLTLTDANGDDIELDVKGTLQDDGNTADGVSFGSGSSWILRNYGTFIKTNTSAIASFRDEFSGGIANIPDSATWIYRYIGKDLNFVSSGMFYPILRFENALGTLFEPDRSSEVFAGEASPLTFKSDVFIDDSITIAINNTFGVTLLQGNLTIGLGSTLTNDTIVSAFSADIGSGLEILGDSIIINGSLDFSKGPSTQGKLVLNGDKQVLVGDPDSVVVKTLKVSSADSAFLEFNLTIQDSLILDEIDLTLGEEVTLTADTNFVTDQESGTEAVSLTFSSVITAFLRLGMPQEHWLRVDGFSSFNRIKLETFKVSPGLDFALVNIQLLDTVRQEGLAGEEALTGVVDRTLILSNELSGDSLSLEFEWSADQQLTLFDTASAYLSLFEDGVWDPQYPFTNFTDSLRPFSILQNPLTIGSSDTAVIAIASLGLLGPTIYQTRADGLWSDTASWEVAYVPAGPFEPATFAPFNINSDSILVRDSVVLDTNLTIGQLVVVNTGVLKVDSTITLANEEVGPDLLVEGTYIDDGAIGNDIVFEASATWALDTGATFVKTNSGNAEPYRDNYEGGIESIPDSADWIYRYTGDAEPFVIRGDMTYPFLTFENVSGSVATFLVTDTVSTFRTLSTEPTPPSKVKRDFRIQGWKVNYNVANDSFGIVEGDLIIEADGELVNSAATKGEIGNGLIVKGDLIIDGIFDFSAGDSTVGNLILEGDTIQTISGTSDSIKVNNMVIANDTNIVLQTDLKITDTFDLGDRALLLDGPVTLTLDSNVVLASSNAVVQASTPTGFIALTPVDSRVDVFVGRNSTVEVPLTTIGFLPFPPFEGANTLTITSSPRNGRFDIFLLDEVLANGFSGNAITSKVVGLSWVIVRTSGNGDRAYGLTFDWLGIQAAADFDYSDAYVSTYDKTLMDWVPLNNPSKSFTPGGILTSYSISPDDNVTIALNDTLVFAIGSAGALPIELLSFDAKAIPEGAELFWTTASETNNEFFSIERAGEDLTFREIGRLPGAGTTILSQQYVFVDESPLAGVNYYRLRQVDFDGQFSYSPIRSLQFGQTEEAVRAYPNPANQHLYLRWTTPTPSEGFIRIFHTSGELVYQDRLPAGSNSYDADLMRLPSGVYFVDMNGQKLRVVKR